MARRAAEPLTLDEVLAALDAARSEQIATVLLRRNPDAQILGVRFGDLDKLQKRIRTNSPLAHALWATGTLEGRTLAVRAMDPADLDRATLDAWVAEIDFPTLADEFAKLVYRTLFAAELLPVWTASDADYVRRTGFALLAAFAEDHTNAEPDATFLAYLQQIERELHTSPNWSREIMNQVPVVIGARNDALFDAARATAAAYGKVHVFHGDKTQCKVIDAVATLDKQRAKRLALAGD